MTKRKTKLVCVGWGIWDLQEKRFWFPRKDVPRCINWPTRKEAIRAYDTYYVGRGYMGIYKWDRCDGLAIAKKLWVEVKDE